MNRKQQRAFKLLMWILGISLGAYIAGRPLYWHINDTLNSFSSNSCPPCHCDCSFQPLLSLPEGTPNNGLLYYEILKYAPSLILLLLFPSSFK
ncbi:hypothetical protein Lalb_Chr15g0087721 [Lupinus albus]|uniref:Uncharacterized protein n=1 Tax=Lupinus albus TaxID=3870 RepID=A0A6A4PEU9_LUPAL|nr:hypothetical protein Lalb_Chr15g0087721 [Lupinus albus]